ncbi:MAG: dihydroneopterin aldolase [Bacteroidetes bacterium]|nr:dihydroneopterin aldolase [Bacteroidota bacterium]
MGIIQVTGIRCYAYHGCNQEEATIGGSYIVDVNIETDFDEAALTDDLSKTVDYVEVSEIVKQEMAIRSKLIEHAAQRICNHLLKSIQRIQKVEVRLTKLSPPINGDVEKVTVKIAGTR